MEKKNLSYKTFEDRRLIINDVLAVIQMETKINLDVLKIRLNVSETTCKIFLTFIEKLNLIKDKKTALDVAQSVINYYSLNGNRITLIEELAMAYLKMLGIDEEEAVKTEVLLDELSRFAKIKEQAESRLEELTSQMRVLDKEKKELDERLLEIEEKMSPIKKELEQLMDVLSRF